MSDKTARMARLERRLAAIVVADIVGYSRLMAEDEEGTISAMQAVRDELTEPKVRAGGGRVVKRTGDGTLLEFGSVVDAARVAVDVQQSLHQRNMTAETPLRLRIGLHLGDVLVEPDGDIHGDGVNVAARLETLCAPGEILLSGVAWEEVQGKLDVPSQALGPRSLKNIPRKVTLHRLIPVADDMAVPEPEPGKMALPLPQKPSIVVLPFQNMSSDPDQEFLCDGLVEDVTTALGRFRSIFVIARNTAFAFRDQAVNLREVGQALGVQYVLQGSVRRSQGRVRVTAQLIDATADKHVWSERYDRTLDDVFALQDDMTEMIARAVAPEIDAAEMARARTETTGDVRDWEVIARAMNLLYRFSASSNEEAEDLLRGALARSPDQPALLSTLALGVMMAGVYGWHRPVRESFATALDLARKAVTLDGKDDRALAVMGVILNFSRQHAMSSEAFEAALAVNPNNAFALGNYGMNLLYLHDPRAPGMLEDAARHSPHDPWMIAWLATRGFIEFLARRYEAALPWGERALRANPRFLSALRLMASSLGMLDRPDEARVYMARILEIMPNVTLQQTRASVPLATKEDEALFVEGLRRAGMPEA